MKRQKSALVSPRLGPRVNANMKEKKNDGETKVKRLNLRRWTFSLLSLSFLHIYTFKHVLFDSCLHVYVVTDHSS